MGERFYTVTRKCNVAGFKTPEVKAGRKECPVEGTSIEVAHPRGPNLAINDSLAALNQECGGPCSWCGQKANSTSGVDITDSSPVTFRVAQAKDKTTLRITPNTKS